MNQTVDHYAMVLQIASYLLHRGATVEVNHYETADVVATINGVTIAVEYERDRSHTAQQLIEKNQKLLKQYDKVLFVSTSTNYKFISADRCIGENQTAARGFMLREHLDNLIYAAEHKNTCQKRRPNTAYSAAVLPLYPRTCVGSYVSLSLLLPYCCGVRGVFGCIFCCM